MVDQYGLKCNSSSEIYYTAPQYDVSLKDTEQFCVFYPLNVIAQTYMVVKKFGLLLVFV
jgi:hypothetical protein